MQLHVVTQLVGPPAGSEERFQQLFNDDAASRTTLQTFIHEVPDLHRTSSGFMSELHGLIPIYLWLIMSDLSMSDELGGFSVSWETFHESKTVKLAEKEGQTPVRLVSLVLVDFCSEGDMIDTTSRTHNQC